MPEPLSRSFFARDALDLAPLLLNKLLAADERLGRIVEVEAYLGESDPASHAYRGRTARNATMFGRPGMLYVYFTYGMHFCANVVSGPEGDGQAVLLRALEPLSGVEAMRADRQAGRRSAGGRQDVPRLVRERDLCRGPARLCQAMGIDRRHDGVDLTVPDGPVTVLDDGLAPPRSPCRTPRVGIRVATERPWRFSVPGHRGVSSPRPSGSHEPARPSR